MRTRSQVLEDIILCKTPATAGRRSCSRNRGPLLEECPHRGKSTSPRGTTYRTNDPTDDDNYDVAEHLRTRSQVIEDIILCKIPATAGRRSCSRNRGALLEEIRYPGGRRRLRRAQISGRSGTIHSEDEDASAGKSSASACTAASTPATAGRLARLWHEEQLLGTPSRGPRLRAKECAPWRRHGSAPVDSSRRASADSK